MFRVLFAFLLINVSGFAQRYETVHYGYWQNASVWQNELIPPHGFSDSVIIRHPVALQHGLVNSGFMRIEQGGALCGHENMTVSGKMEVYGFFELDSLLVDGGEVRHYGPGASVATYQTAVINGGMFSLTGGSLSVGPWFDCRQSDFFYIGLEENDINPITISQTNGQIFISGVEPGTRISLTDLSGRQILETVSDGNELAPDYSGQLLILAIWNEEQLLSRKLMAIP